MARRHGLTCVLVLGTEPGSPAGLAGLRSARWTDDGAFQPGDMIIAVGGRQIESSIDLVDALDAYAPGDQITIRVLRDGEEEYVTCALDDPR